MEKRWINQMILKFDHNNKQIVFLKLVMWKIESLVIIFIWDDSSFVIKSCKLYNLWKFKTRQERL